MFITVFITCKYPKLTIQTDCKKLQKLFRQKSEKQVSLTSFNQGKGSVLRMSKIPENSGM